MVDATCAPADIAYPVDVRLLHRARLQSEALIDELHAQRPSGSLKPRTYREKLQHKWRVFIKIRKPLRAKIQDNPLFNLLVGFNEASVPTSEVF